MAGAKLTIYNANTTTPTNIYRNAGLTVAATNPTTGSDVSDAGGWFPQFFAADGTVVDITLKNASGSTIKTWEDVTFVSGDTENFERVLPDGTRFKIDGSGSRVLLQAGDASPDDVGGKLTIEGWAGTQLEDAIFDTALLNVTGKIQQNGKGLTGSVYTPNTPFSGVTTVDITLPNVPSGCRMWEVNVWDIVTSTAVGELYGRLSYDGGANYKSGGSDYLNGGGAGSSLELATDYDMVGNAKGVMTLFIVTPDSGSAYTSVYVMVRARDNASTNAQGGVRFAFGQGSYGRATNLRLYRTSGDTLTGAYNVIPHLGYGEA